MGDSWPSGTVTFLFTDIEGSTRLWDQHPDDMTAALRRHDEVLRRIIGAHDGYVFATGGDGFAVAFPTATHGIDAAVEAQQALIADEDSDAPVAIRVRMGLHTGTAEERDGNYFGPALNVAARIMGCAWPRQVVASAVCATLGERPDLVSSLGSVQLAGLASPVDVCQITPIGFEAKFPPLRTLDAVPNNLPRQRTAFVGREREIEAIVDDLASWPLVTLTGVGGVGKTRLSLQVAERCLPEFPAGVYFVELATVLQPSGIIDALADAIRPPRLRGGGPRESLVDYLSSRRILIVIDNCEHVIDDVAELVDHIVAAGDEIRILATSREGLGLDGERLRAVQPLKAGSVEHSGPAEALFALRLAAAAPDFELDAAQGELVRLICERLDGVPLALELAAARASTMSLTGILERLEQRFQLLRGGRRAVTERHQTLRNTVGWSYGLLDEGSQRLFARLSVFAGTFALDSAEQLCADDGATDVAEGLGALVSKSMVEAIRVPGRPLRYRLLETLRQFAAEQLEASGETHAWRDRHAATYATLIVQLGERLHSVDEIAALTRLPEELPNVRAALLWVSETDRPDLAARLTGPLGLQLNWEDRFTSLAAGAIRVGAASDPEWGHAVLLAEIGNCYGFGDVERARTALSRLTAIDREHPNLPALKAVGAGVVAFTAGDFDAGIEGFTRAHQAADGADEYTQLWCALLLTAYSSAHSRPIHQPAEFGVELARRLGIPTMLAFALSASSMMYRDSRPEHALALVDEALAIDVPMGGISGIRHVTRGQILFRQGRWPEALAEFTDGLEGLLASGIFPEGSHALALGATCLHQLGRAEDGTDLFRRSAGVFDMQLIALYGDVERDAADLIGESFPPSRPEPPLSFDELARQALAAFKAALM